MKRLRIELVILAVLVGVLLLLSMGSRLSGMRYLLPSVKKEVMN